MGELDVTRKPVPSPKPEAMPFWDGLREGQIRLQRCDECRRVQFYPRPHCRYCGSLALTWEALSGEASVYSYTVIHRAPFAAFMLGLLLFLRFDDSPSFQSSADFRNVEDGTPSDTFCSSIFVKSPAASVRQPQRTEP